MTGNRVGLSWWGLSEPAGGWCAGSPANQAGVLDSASCSPGRMGGHTEADAQREASRGEGPLRLTLECLGTGDTDKWMLMRYVGRRQGCWIRDRWQGFRDNWPRAVLGPSLLGLLWRTTVGWVTYSNGNIFLTLLETEKSKVKMPARLRLMLRPLFLACWQLPLTLCSPGLFFVHVQRRGVHKRVLTGISFSKDTNLTASGPHPLTSFYPRHTISPDIVTLGIRAST